MAFLLSRVTRLGEFLPIGHICQFGENYRSSANSWAAFFHNTSYVLILTKKWWGYILATFLQAHLVTLLLTLLCYFAGKLWRSSLAFSENKMATSVFH
jgi:hypothetical protein